MDMRLMVERAEMADFDLDLVIWLGGKIANDLVLDTRDRLADDGLSDLLDHLLEPPPNADPSVACLTPRPEALLSETEEIALCDHLCIERRWGFVLKVSVAHRTWHSEKSASLHMGWRRIGWVYAESFEEALVLAANWAERQVELEKKEQLDQAEEVQP